MNVKTPVSFFRLESRRFFSRRNILFFFLFLLLCLYLVQDGLNEYKQTINNKEEFLETEESNIRFFINYSQYGLYGFRLMFVPPVLTAFSYNSGAVPPLTAFVDSGVRLRIYYSLLGKNLYRRKDTGFMDFSGFILLFGSIFALFCGYFSLWDKEYLLFLCSLGRRRRLFFFIAGGRFLLLLAMYLTVIAAALLLTSMNGISFSPLEYTHLWVFALVSVLMLLFFQLIGMGAGTVRTRATGVVVIATIWFGSVFFLPSAVSRITARGAGDLPSAYDLERRKLEVLSRFEKDAYRDTKRYQRLEDKKESDRMAAEQYWTGQFQTIRTMEKHMELETRAAQRLYGFLSACFPTTFYLAAGTEIGGRGYRNTLDFYAYVQDLKRKFVRYYIDKKYHSNYAPVESFVRGQENLFQGRSRLPGNFGLGISLCLAYILAALGIAYRRFRRFIFPHPGKEAGQLAGLDLELKGGETYALLTNSVFLNRQLYNVFSGEKLLFEGRVRLDEMDLPVQRDGNRGGPSSSFVYLCSPGHLPPGLKVGDFIRFLKYLLKLSNKSIAELYVRIGIEHIEEKSFEELTVLERGQVLLAAARLKKCGLYMLEDFFKGVPPGFISWCLEELQKIKNLGAAVLYSTDDVLLASRIGDRAGSLRSPGVSPKLDAYNLL